MKILTYPIDLGIGESQIGAIELSAEMQRLGHEVAVYGQEGILSERVRELNLEFIRAPRAHSRPTRAVVSSLRAEVNRRGTQIVHGYEWAASLESTLACRRTEATPVSTVFSMSVAPFIPVHVPMLVRTEQVRTTEQASGRQHVGLMGLPVDIRMNSPHVSLPLRTFRGTWNLDPDAFTVLVASNVAHEANLEGILTAIETVGRLSRKHRTQLIVVGGGDALTTVRKLAHLVNSEADRTVIVVTGEMVDPRPAYAVADVMVGTGASVVRAMAFGKPVIVQGAEGYFEPLTANTLPYFLQQGWCGHGSGPAGGFGRLYSLLTALLKDPEERRRRAEFSLRVARERFSLTDAAEQQLDFFERVHHAPRGSGAQSAMSYSIAAHRFVQHRLRTRVIGG